MKRLFLILFVILCIPFAKAQDIQDVDSSQYLQELNSVKKNVIDFKQDFYSFKLQQEKLNQNISNPEQTNHTYILLLAMLGCLGLFFVWQIAKNLKIPFDKLSDKRLEDFLKNQAHLLSEIEGKIETRKSNDVPLKEADSIKFFEGLVASLDELLKKDPQNDKYLYEKAESEAFLNKKVSALRDLRKAIEINPKWKKDAKKSFYFKKISNFVEFKKIVE